MKAKIYTKTGDKGQTSLVGGTRVSKADARLDAYGTLDELNSVLGLVRAFLPGAGLRDFAEVVEPALETIQNNLFNIGSHLACEKAEIRAKLPGLHAGSLATLEKQMDAWEAELPPLRNFILPGGSSLAGFAHLARTVCRRGEREAVRMGDLDPQHMIYLNRLSDWLFLLAREFNHRLKQPDLEWQKG
jgi:cob(I)alamin adenosyltransferase